MWELFQSELSGGLRHFYKMKTKIIIPVSLQLMQGLIKLPADINYNVNSVFFRKSNILVVQLIMM